MTARRDPRSETSRIAEDRQRDVGYVSSDAPPTDPALLFPAVARLELDVLLQQVRDRADDVLSSQGRLRGLLRANAAVAADLSLPVVLHRVADAARELLAARYAAIGVVGPDGQLEHVAHSGLSAETAALIGQLPRGLGIGVPIRVGDAVFGTLYVTERVDGGEFTSDDEQLATALAVAAGGAIANARLFTESEQRRRWLVASGELTNQLLTVDCAQPLRLITHQAATAADADFATLVVPHGDDEVIVAAVAGTLATGLAGQTAPLHRSLAGRAIVSGRPIFAADHGEESPAMPLPIETGPLIVVPLTAGKRSRGALTLGRGLDREPFTEIDLDMAAGFATRAALALELADSREAQVRLNRMEDHDRIAGDLHDHVIQELFALGMGLQGLASVTDRPAHLKRIDGYIDTLDRVVGTIRTAIFQLQPAGPDPAGLRSRILDIAAEHTDQLGFSPDVRFAGTLDAVVDATLAADVLAVVREAISNCARHAHATSLDISLALRESLLVVEITDDGGGLGTHTRSSGLTNMRRRAEKHDGTLTIATPVGGGTALTWTVNAAH